MLLIRVILILLFSVQLAHSFSFEQYLDKDIDDICKEYQVYLKEELKNNLKPSINLKAHITSGKYLFIKDRVKYLGKIKNLSKEHLEDIKFFENTFSQLPHKISEISTKEVLVLSKSGKKYWMPIQDVLIEPLKKEITKNQEIYVYVVVLRHHVATPNQCRGSYLISEFQSVTKDSLQQDKIKELYSKGQSLIKENKLDEAEIIFKKILELNPANDDALSNICLIDQKREKYNDALNCYNKVIQIDSEAYEAFFSKGIIFFRQKKPNEAIKELDKAIELFYKQKLPIEVLGDAYYLRANSKELIGDKDAVNDLKKARELNPDIVSEEKLAEFHKKFEK